MKSCTFSADTPCKLDVFRHNGNTLGVDGAEVGVLEKSNHVGLSSLLKGKDGGGLESEVSLEVRGDFSNESLERKLSDKEFSGFLILSDHSEGDGSWSESVSFLHSGDLSVSLLGGLGNHLSWGLGSGVLSSGLLSSCHFE